MIKAVILAAGWGTRMRPLTYTRPKPLLKIAGKSLLEHNLDQLEGLVEEVILVVGYKSELIRKELGEEYRGIKIKYVTQKEQLGTGDATETALPFLNNKFLVLNGDDLYQKKDLKKCLKKNPSILVKEVEDPSGFGQIIHKNGKIKDLKEKPLQNVSNLINIGAYFINKNFFKIKPEKEKEENGITDYVKQYLKKEPINYQIAETWFPASYPWNLLELTEYILKKQKGEIKGKIEKGALLEGSISIGKNTIIKTGTRIEGPVYIGENCEIGPNANIRPYTSIENGCKAGQGVEIKNSILNKGTKVPHLSYVGDSVLGENCNLGAGTIIANLLFEEKTIKTKVKGEIFDTKRRKLGCIMGDNVKTGINVSIMPGVMIGNDSLIYPHSLVKKNVEKESVYKE